MPIGAVGQHAASWLQRVLAAIVVLYASRPSTPTTLSRACRTSASSSSPSRSSSRCCSRSRWDRRLLRPALAVVAAEALLFVVVGLVEYASRDLLWNGAVIRSNEFHVYFRVNSLFWDPNIYGRYLALASSPWRRPCWSAASAAPRERCGARSAVIWLGLATTFSQSSFVALLAGLAVLAALRWSLRWIALACGRRCARRHRLRARRRRLAEDRPRSGGTVNKDTSGRADLISGGASSCRATALLRLRVGLVLDRLPPNAGGKAAGDRVPHRADHDRRRAGRDRPGRSTWRCWSQRCGRCSAGLRRVMPGLGRELAARRDGRGPTGCVAGCRPRGVHRALLVHTLGLRRLPRATRSPGCCWRSRVAGDRAPPRGSGRWRLPAPPGDHRRGLYGVERSLEADRGRAAAALHAVPDPGRLRRGRGPVRRGDRRQHRRPAGRDRGAAALLLQADEDPDEVVATSSRRCSGRPRGGADALPFAEPISEALLDQLRRRPGPDRDRRPLGAHPLRVPADALPPRRAGPGLLRLHDGQRPGGDPGDGLCWWWSATRARRGCCSAPTDRRGLRPGPDRRPPPPPLSDPGRRPAAPDAAFRPADDAGRALALLAQLHRPDHPRPPRRPRRGGLYSLAVKFAQGVNVLVRGFQLAWPPLAYSIRDDDEARRAYALIVTWFSAVLRLRRRRHVAAGALDRAGPRRARVLRLLRGGRPGRRPGSRSTRSTWSWS